MTLALDELEQMKMEFSEIFVELLEDGSKKLKEHLSAEI
jgi:hypothetical protein